MKTHVLLCDIPSHGMRVESREDAEELQFTRGLTPLFRGSLEDCRAEARRQVRACRESGSYCYEHNPCPC